MSSFEYREQFYRGIDQRRLQTDREYFRLVTAQGNAYDAEQFPVAVTDAGWSYLGPEDELSLAGSTVVVVGAARWSNSDLRFLAKLEQSTRGREHPIYVFDTGAVPDTTALHRLLPKLPHLPHQSLILVRYERDEPALYLQGEDAEAYLDETEPLTSMARAE